MTKLAPDSTRIHDVAAAHDLAELVMSMNLTSDMSLKARELARRVLGVGTQFDHGATPIVTNGTLRLVPREEPVFLIRGQDAVGAAAVRAWISLAEQVGAAPEILEKARAQAELMDAWPRKKTPDAAAA